MSYKKWIIGGVILNINQQKFGYDKDKSILSFPFRNPDYIPVNVKDALLHLHILKNMKNKKGEK